MIISASRRTDIPAFFGTWLMNRIQAGYCLVPNPMNAHQVARVSLLPRDVDAFVFWTKNPSPFLEHLPTLDRLGFRYYFQFTVNDYDRSLESMVPALDQRLDVFARLVNHVGPARVIWRYDPIIISTRTPYDFHEKRFRSIAEKLRGCTKTAVVSIVDFYRKTDTRLKRLEQSGWRFDHSADGKPEMMELLRSFKSIADSNGLEIRTCAEAGTAVAGIKPGRCVDVELIYSVWGARLPGKKDTGQRGECGCAVSKDIGMPDTCMHHCTYCYATRNAELAEKRFEAHDPRGETLYPIGAAKTPGERKSEGSGQLPLWERR